MLFPGGFIALPKNRNNTGNLAGAGRCVDTSQLGLVLGVWDCRMAKANFQSSEGFQEVALECQGQSQPQGSSPAPHLDAVLVQPLVQADPQVHAGLGHPDGHIHGNSNGTEAQLAGQEWQGISSVSLRFSLTYSKNFCCKYSRVKYFIIHIATGSLMRQT